MVTHHTIHECCPSWDDIVKGCQFIARAFDNWFTRPDGIIAVARGGLIPASIISHLLNVRIIDTICIESYYGGSITEPRITKLPTIAGKGTMLVIDELTDTGRTLRLVRTALRNAIIATLYAKPMGVNAVDIYSTKINHDTWVSFPWETRRQGSIKEATTA